MADSGAAPQLLISSGESAGKTFPLEEGKALFLGRDPDCIGPLADSKISRRHCRIVLSGGNVIAEDLGSRNGTFVNEERVGRAVLGPGDVLRVGRTQLLVRWPCEEGAPTSTVYEAPDTRPAACEGCGKAMERGIAGAPGARRVEGLAVCPECVTASPLLGQRISNFLVLWRVAEGGASVLYRAIHTMTEVELALKVFREDLAATPKAVSRFLREARIAARLSHPNIVRFYDAGQAGPVLYIAMEFVRGKDLAELVQKGPLDPMLVRRVAADILRALIYTDGLGIVHRDIKPGNILVPQEAIDRSLYGRSSAETAADPTDHGAGGSGAVAAKLADFNISKALRASGADTSTVTEAGSIVGTMMYMAPEQITDVPNSDIRADLYSLGASIYEAATGKRPFAHSVRSELARQILKTPPIPPSKLCPLVSPALEAVILKAMAKKPEDRFQTPGDMLAAFLG
ncbi:MAG: protein kinase [Planctomycetes bacterium]|nr:protein kinase [Planctomycetota bacterium]